MNIKISLLSVVMLTMSVYAGAQTARNPLNHEPARVTIKKNPSSWKLTDETFYRNDGTQFDKRSITYDDNGRKISEVTQGLSGDGKLLKNRSKCDYIYEESKYIVISADANLSGWQNTTKVETVYNPDKKPVYSLSYSWDGSIDDWSVTPSLKCEWVYDRDGRIAEYTKQRMNKGTKEWDASYARIIYSYDVKGEVGEELYQSWNTKDKSWTDEGRYVYSNDSKDQKMAMSYINLSDKWVADGKTIYTYDEEGKVIRGDFFESNSENTPRAYCLYSYTENSRCEVVSETEDIDIHPNPVITSFELTVPDALVGKPANIFDVWGKHVKSVIVNSEKMQIDVNGLPGGVYVLHVGEKTKKLVIK